jgi:hypothetical protein
MFHLSGPGVNISSDLLPCENPRELLTITLRPSSTYAYEDSRHPELGRIVFATSSGGSSAETSSGAGRPATGAYSGSVTNTSPVGSGVKPIAGTLSATVSSAGITLSRQGRSVSLLKSGRYRIAVDDRTRSAGFTIERTDKKPVPITGASFVGKRAVTLDLRPGEWLVYSAAGKKRRFTVIA